MRPDEHKQKKNVQYKKKHGIQGTGNKTKDEVSNKPHESESITKYKNDGANGQTKNGLHFANKNQPFEDPLDHQSFSRRQIESNWSRYDDSESTSQQIGDDFDVVLSSAGAVSSHMKLQHEKDWEGSEELDDYLMIDCKTIADALSQLSFCDLHCLDSALLDPSLLKLLQEDSTEAEVSQMALPQLFAVDQDKFDFGKPKSTSDSRITNAEVENRLGNLEDFVADIPASTVTGKDIITTTIELPLNSLRATGPDNPEHQDSRSSETAKSVTTDENVVAKSPPDVVDAADSQCIETTSDANTSTKEHSKTDELEDELDALLSGETVQTSQRKKSDDDTAEPAYLKVESKTNVVQQPAAGAGSEDQQELEDWLDSII